eukprot:scaffold1923_cov235-Ochromonas_danica.AAC.2
MVIVNFRERVVSLPKRFQTEAHEQGVKLREAQGIIQALESRLSHLQEEKVWRSCFIILDGGTPRTSTSIYSPYSRVLLVLPARIFDVSASNEYSKSPIFEETCFPLRRNTLIFN